MYEGVSEEAWPMLRHDPPGTGSDGSSLMAPLEKAWEFQAGGGIESPLAAAYGLVFFGCDDKCIYAVEASSGAKKWVFKTQGGISECPVVADGVVYAASGDKNIYAIDAKTGMKRWQFSTREEISTPAVAFGMVFFGCKDKNIYALDASTGQKKWEHRSDFKDHSPPTPFEDKVFISGSGLISRKSFAIDAQHGNVLWELDNYGSDMSPTVVSENEVIVRSLKGRFAVIDIAGGKETRELYTKDTTSITRSGNFLFSTNKYPHDVFRGPLTGLHAEDLLRQPSMEYATTGFHWAALLEEGSVSSPATGGDFVFVSAIGRKSLFGINMRRFMRRWEFSLNENIKSPPIVADGMLFVASEKGKIHAFRGAKDPNAMAVLEQFGEIVREPLHRVAFPQTEFSWPNSCCLCCGPAEKRALIQWKESKNLTHTIANIPYCAPCHAKVTKLLAFKRDWPGVAIQKPYPTAMRRYPTILGFRNEKYCAMFMEANRLR
jgi:outer membrane protein assembly factor BamB